MPKYTSDQVKDLLHHIVLQVNEPYGRAPSVSDSSDILSPINLAAALRAVGIPAQANTKTLITTDNRPSSPEISQIVSSSELSPQLEVIGAIFSPYENAFTSWDAITNDPHFVNIQSNGHQAGLSLEWLAPTPATCPETPEHVTDLLEIIKEWQAGVQHTVLTEKLSTADKAKPSPFKKM